MTIIEINNRMDKGFQEWLIERDKESRRFAIILGSILYVIGIAIFVFLAIR